MSERDEYPAGVPCWVEGLHRDCAAARDFYGPLMGWEFEGSGDEPQYFFVARLRREVAGLGAYAPTGPGHRRHDDPRGRGQRRRYGRGRDRRGR